MKITRNDDGTVTVLVPKADEVYDQSDGGLYIGATLPEDEFNDLVDEALRADEPKKGKKA